MGGALLSIWGDTRLHTHVFSNQPLQPVFNDLQGTSQLTFCSFFFVGLQLSQVIEDIKSAAYSGKLFFVFWYVSPRQEKKTNRFPGQSIWQKPSTKISCKPPPSQPCCLVESQGIFGEIKKTSNLSRAVGFSISHGRLASKLGPCAWGPCGCLKGRHAVLSTLSPLVLTWLRRTFITLTPYVLMVGSARLVTSELFLFLGAFLDPPGVPGFDPHGTGLVYLPTGKQKSTINVGKYTSPMDLLGVFVRISCDVSFFVAWAIGFKDSISSPTLLKENNRSISIDILCV